MSKTLSHLDYRPDIDGLRALAVLSVVFYHAFPEMLGGGFVGVDIFFVISGFLISSIIYRSLEDDNFSVRVFYARRIRRIFPALITILVSCFALGWFVLLADEFKQLGKHIAGGAGFISNFLLWSESGYFDAEAKTKPLLHLWSLGVEEQFYIVFPVLLWACWKARVNMALVLVVIALLSFLTNMLSVQDDAAVAFYSPLSRFWELMIGALLAYYEKSRGASIAKPGDTVNFGESQPPGANFQLAGLFYGALPWLGLSMVIGAFVFIDEGDQFSGLLALVPVAGAALIVYGGNNYWLNRRVLGSKVLVWVGLISYPLYLWHWPLLSISMIIQGQPATPVIRLSIVVISVVLAWLTFRFIERPVRSTKQGGVKTSVLVILMAVVGAVGLWTFSGEGLPARSGAQQSVVKQGGTGHTVFHRYSQDHFYKCTPRHLRQKALWWDGYLRCQQSKQRSPIDMVLLGDSHAEHLFIGLAEALPGRNVGYYIQSGMPIKRNNQFKGIIRYITKSEHIRDVVISAYWWKRGGVPIDELILLARHFEAAGKRIYLTDDVPTFEFQPERCKLQRRFRRLDQCTQDIAPGYLEIYRQLREVIGKAPDVKLIETSNYLCDGSRCSMSVGDKLLYRDSNHLNVSGSQYVADRIVSDFPELLR